MDSLHIHARRDAHKSDLMRVFVNYLPNNINKEGLAVEFLKSDISIRKASIHPAWNKSYFWADIVVAATDYAKALGMDNKLIFGTAIRVKPFSSRSKYQKSPQNMPHGQEMRFTADLNGVEWSVVQLFRILQRQGQICAAMIRPMRLFVNNLPNNINNEALAVEFLKYDIVILSASIQPAWNKDYCWADLAVAETDYNKALEIGNRLFWGRSITVKPFTPKGKVPQSICPGQGMRFTVDLNSREWSVLQLFRILQSQGVAA
ncbi:hypothetical protein B0H14DRAFT_2734191 [Mycena olivaceomarginata]|nr:hypothetical protein B0H14DRAFT_2734191 [Mycena olivaceomarginata]